MPRQIEELINQQILRSELAQRRGPQPAVPGIRPVVTITRRKGSGARVVAEKLAADLGFSLWDRELIDLIASDAKVSRRLVESFDEKTISEIEVLVRSIFGDKEMGSFIYETHLVRTIAAIARLGNAIILGRGARFLIPEALHIRIDASEEHRIRNLMLFEGMSREAATAAVRESDRERQHFLESLFGKERVQKAHYDLTIWMDRFSVDDAAEVLRTAVIAWFNLPREPVKHGP